MPQNVKQEASTPNPASSRSVFSLAHGIPSEHTRSWPGTTLHGRTSFEWIEGGAFLIMRSEIHERAIPSAVAIFGSDDSTGEYFMLYFDERGVSRKYEVTLRDNIWRWCRNAPGFSQRFTGTLSDDGRTIVGKGEVTRDGATWENDLELTYTRAE